VFRNLPLERLHPIAFHAAEVANCADKTGQFWTVHDRFFQEPKVVAATEYDDRATRAGVGADSLGLCLKEGSATRQVQADLKLAEELKLASTPAFLLGKVMSDRLVVSKVILGARPKADFEEAIETELKAVANR
jgi:protein-disulfide isomerase